MERIEEPLKFERVTRRFAVYVGGATVSPVYIDKHRLLLTVGSAYRSIKVATFNRPGLQNFTVLDGDQGHDLTGITFHPILDWSIDLQEGRETLELANRFGARVG